MNNIRAAVRCVAKRDLRAAIKRTLPGLPRRRQTDLVEAVEWELAYALAGYRKDHNAPGRAQAWLDLLIFCLAERFVERTGNCAVSLSIKTGGFVAFARAVVACGKGVPKVTESRVQYTMRRLKSSEWADLTPVAFV